jgi:TonB family protein
MTKDCARAEVLAGAVALGEATDHERDAYRQHLALCPRCIEAFGGEREIERIMQTVAQARDAERWEPDVRASMATRGNRGRRFWRFGFAAAAAALAISVGIHALVASRVTGPVELVANAPVTDGAFHVSLERRTPAAQPVRPAPRAAVATHALVVVHNVVTLNRPPSPARTVPSTVAPTRPAASSVHQPVATAPVEETVAAAGPSRHDEKTIASLQTVATADPPAGSAESMAIVPNVVHEVAPLGGENAIVPHPAALAYDERAEGTTVYDVSVDERGVPVKCTITKSSSYMVLDVAVCKAAMNVRYTPRTINGHPVAGVYHDAFTFRYNDDE